jgi:hypothetical protein
VEFETVIVSAAGQAARRATSREVDAAAETVEVAYCLCQVWLIHACAAYEHSG